MKRSSESSCDRDDRVFLIRSLTKTLCGSPEETHRDFNGQTRFAQEDDSGIKSGKRAKTLRLFCLINALIWSFLYSLFIFLEWFQHQVLKSGCFDVFLWAAAGLFRCEAVTLTGHKVALQLLQLHIHVALKLLEDNVVEKQDKNRNERVKQSGKREGNSMSIKYSVMSLKCGLEEWIKSCRCWFFGWFTCSWTNNMHNLNHDQWSSMLKESQKVNVQCIILNF